MAETIRQVVERLHPNIFAGQPAPEHKRGVMAAARRKTAFGLLGTECIRNILDPYLYTGMIIHRIRNNIIVPDGTVERGGVISAENMQRMVGETRIKYGLIKVYNGEGIIHNVDNLRDQMPVNLGPGYERSFRQIGTEQYYDSNYIRIPFPLNFVPVCILPCGLIVGSTSGTTVQLCKITKTIGGCSVQTYETSQPYEASTVWNDYGQEYHANSLDILVSEYWCEYVHIRVAE